MSPSLVTPVPCSLSPSQDAEPNQLKKQIRLVVQAVATPSPFRERRLQDRHPYPYPINITPISDEGEILGDETFTAVGRHISEMGVDFYHTAPIPYRSVIATLTKPNDDRVVVLMNLTWCRFGQHGLYENGGRFVRVVDGD